MNKISHTLKIIGILVTALFFAIHIKFAYAADANLVVEFEQTPLFSEANFMPGTVVSRMVKVTNNTGESKNIITEAININDLDGFGSVLHMTVKEGTTVFFDGTLADFFHEGEVALSSLVSSASTTHIYSVAFASDVDNSYQKKILGFDILVGFEGDTGNSNSSDDPHPQGNTSGGGGNDGGGQGGGGGIQGLSVSGESASITNVEETTATIEWTTSYQSTSRVVYGTTPGLFDFSLSPHYGYPFSTVESDTPAHPNGVLVHSVHISGLNPGTTYYFRSISHASPDTIGFEYRFTTKDSNSITTSSGHLAQNISSGDSLPHTATMFPVEEKKDIVIEKKDTSSVTVETAMPATVGIAQNDENMIKADHIPSGSLFAGLFTILPFGKGWDIMLIMVVLAIFPFIVRMFLRRIKKEAISAHR